MDEMDIDPGFNKISDEDLDTLVQQYRQENPGGGRAYIIGRLRAAHSLRVQRHRDSLYPTHRSPRARIARTGWKEEGTNTISCPSTKSPLAH